MRNIATSILLLALFLVACVTKTANEKSVKPQTLFIVIYDISKSVDQYAVLKPSHFESVYPLIGYSGGGKFYGLLIKSDSRKQEPFTYTVSTIDTLPLKGNRIQVGHIRKKNRGLKEAFQSGSQQFVNSASAALILDKKEPFSDVQNALLMAKQILNMPQYSAWVKKVLIISDMENDLPPRDGMDPIKAFDFGIEVRLGIVRPSVRVDLGKTFPNLTTANYTTIDDGITSILSH
jgi:hypothetical protein